jgi:hypothetical protein
MTSPDGIEWTERTCPESTWSSITYGNGLFIAVASAGTGLARTMVSSTGLTWTAIDASEANTWNSVVYGNNLFVAVSSDGTNRAMVSSTGLMWSAISIPSNDWRSITYGNYTFIALAYESTGVLTSSTGISWTSHTSADSLQWKSISYGNNIFVAVSENSRGDSKSIMISSTGASWELQTSVEDTTWQSITFDETNNLFVAVANTGTIRVMTTEDGITWIAGYQATVSPWNAVVAGNGTTVAISVSGTYQSMYGTLMARRLIIYNPSLLTWNLLPLSGDMSVDIDGVVTANPLTVTKNTAIQTLTNKTLTSPIINGGTVNDITALSVLGNVDITGDLTITGDTTIVNTTNLTVTDKLLTINKGGIAATSTGIEIERNGTIVGYIKVDAIGDSYLLKAPDGSILTLSTTANKTLTIAGNLNVESDSNINQDLTTNSNTVEFSGLTVSNSLVMNGELSGTYFKNENNLASNSPTAVPSQASVKSYVDSQTAATGITYATSSTGTCDYQIGVANFSGYTAGQVFIFKADVSNTGASTLAINTSTGVAIKKVYNKALIAGDILAGQLVEVVYDGTNFQMLTPASKPPLFREAIFTVVSSTEIFDLDDELDSADLPATEEYILCYIDTTYQARDTYTYDSVTHIVTLDTEQPPDTKVVFLVQTWG